MSPTYMYRLIRPRPTFDLDVTDDEREIVGRARSILGGRSRQPIRAATSGLARIEIGTMLGAFVRTATA